MIQVLGKNLVEVVRAVAPLVLTVCVLQFTLIWAPFEAFAQFLIGTVLSMAGMLLLFIGIDLGLLPMGRFVGAELPRRGSLALIVAVAFAAGFALTVAEPDVMVLADQIQSSSAGRIPATAVLYTTALGVALLTALALPRIVFGWPLKIVVTLCFGAVLLLTLFAPAEFVPLAYDAGSVTTGVLTAPVIIALAMGLSTVLAGRDSVSDGFGVLGLASIGAVLALLVMALVWP
jgi:hypothetical protein